MHWGKKIVKKISHPPKLKALTLALLSALSTMVPMAGHADQTISSATTTMVSFNSDNLTITASGSVIVPGSTSVRATGSLGTLSNSGFISGGDIYNAGTINTFDNSGTI